MKRAEKRILHFVQDDKLFGWMTVCFGGMTGNFGGRFGRRIGVHFSHLFGT